MNQPKSQHYVPEMLLKRFTDNDGWLHCCLRRGAGTRFWKTRPKNAFVVRHLYTKRDESGNRDTSVEEGLGKTVESDAEPVIDRIVSCALDGSCPRLPTGERKTLIRLICHQQRRTPEIHPLVDENLENWEADILARFESEAERTATPEELVEIENRETRKTARQSLIADLAGGPPTDDEMRHYPRCPIQFGVIRNTKKSFVIGSRSEPGLWFPVHQRVAFSLADEISRDELVELNDMSEVRRINEQIVRGSLAFAGASEQLVRSLAGSR